MRTRASFAPWTSVGLMGLWACLNASHSPTIVVTGEDASTDSGMTDDYAIDTSGALPDLPTDSCELSDMTDPVALCTEQSVLGFQVEYGYKKGVGAAPSWASMAPYATGTPHSWQDDLGLAGALGAYQCSASVYGNNQSSGSFDVVLSDLDPLLVAELMADPPAGTDGELYFRLRWAQAAYTTVDPVTSKTLGGMADTYGAALQEQAYAVVATADAGDAGSAGGTVIGVRNGDGSVSYAPAQTVMAAAALLDMASLRWNDVDAGTEPVTWAATAQQVLSYVAARARDPRTGLYYQSLVTSADPEHDTLAAASPTSDALLTDTQAWVLLGLARAQDALTSVQGEADGGGSQVFDGSSPTAPPYWVAGDQLVAALTNAKLFDGSTNPPTPPNPGAFVDGIIASTGELLTHKETIANAILLGAFGRIAAGLASSQAYTLGEVRAAMIENMTCNSSLFTVVCASGSPVQQAYLAETSKAYGYASADGAEAGDAAGADAGLLPGASDYETQASVAMVEGFTQLWHGATPTASCAP